ncbi:type VI secretion system Vgr family protein [Polyangium spumosum]|uniref:Type VI secretion system tip protein VgrG n=1 Tax=Polyangium spumosum TaxID=889282 RepID=A0A6N7PVK0_9BACT|nr:type VI secretion system tip protein TssI/VgrG [Polyangium spumosum]MRG94285.1 type VI secretion system tip protein VgrG [Polyangium spumosum]
MALTELITISSSVLPDTTRVVAFRGAEAISRPYEFEIFLSLEGEEGDGLDLGDAIGAKAQLVIDRADDKLPPFVFAGILASVELLHAIEGRSLVRAVLVPRLWLLGLSKHSRIFTKKKLPEVIESILEENSLSGDDYELRLGSYDTEEHICQYRESDLDFISRWMEREGIYYYFIHSEDGEKLVISDGASYENDIVGSPVRYYPQSGQDRSAGPSFRAFTSRHRTLPSMVKLKDYDYARPNLTIAGSSQVSSNGAGEVSLYGERFFSAAAGERLAKLRAEEMLAREVVYQARGSRSHLRAGHVFELEEHPRAALNTKYLAVEVRHHGNQAAGASAFQRLLDLEHDEVYYVEVEAIPEGTQFRPESRTQWPRIYGYENGTVDGPADSEYAQIDDQGRYSVKFKFDETNLKDGKASTFVRMMQPHGGGIEGFHFPLRKATEVVFSFLGGDPDRPVISGVVPNALTPSPVTSGNHTRNVIQTGGRNRLELEDKAGQQRITMSTPYSNTYLRMGSPNADHELILHTDDNTLLDFGANHDLHVGQEGSGTWDVKVKDNWVTHVETGLHELWVDEGSSATTVKGDTMLHVTEGNLFTDVDTGVMETTVKGDTSLQVVSGNYKADVDAGTATVNVKGDTNVTVSAGNTKVDTSGTTDILSGGLISITSSGDDVKIEGNKVSTTSRSDWSWKILGTKVSFSAGSTLDFKLSQATSFTIGMTNSFFAGMTNSFTISSANSFTIGRQLAVFVGGKTGVTVSDELNLTVAQKLSLEAGMSVTIAGSIGIKLVPTEIDQMITDLKQAATNVELKGFKIVI